MSDRIDFNCDMGEGFGAYELGFDEEIIGSITSANIACGFHAGDPSVIRKTVRLAEAHGVGIGAHPSYPDLQGFGRRNMTISPAEVTDLLVYQIGALAAFTTTKRLQHVKPHGALYNMAAGGGDLARAIAAAVLEVDPRLILLVLAGSGYARVAQEMGVRIARETFADREFNADGTLVARSRQGAVIHDINAVVERSIRMVTERTAVAITGEIIPIEADTICLHSDTPGAVALAARLRAEFERAGVRVTRLEELT